MPLPKPFTIDIPESAWEVCVDESRLLAQITVNGLSMHLEAWEVYDTKDGMQCAVQHDEDFERIFYAVGADAAFQTLTIRGREYVLVATPHCV